ncbi:ROK family protein [Lacticaseibacillus jixiensis]|uniref:ROK family protein n=1 Tax=Lacticaseibacillus jixiensis TaxID=3231926 RepID=UPI0036F19835
MQANNDYYAGIDIGGTTIKTALVSAAGQILARNQVATPKAVPNLYQVLAELVAQMQDQQPLAAVGISVPGLVQADGTMLTGGTLTELAGRQLVAEVSGFVHLPVQVLNDANAAALAEHWLGAAQACANYVCITLGTGVGGGIVINGQLYRGKNGGAGEFGWGMIPQCERMTAPQPPLINYTASTINGLVAPYNAQVDTASMTTDAKSIINRAYRSDQTAMHAVLRFVNEVALLCVDVYAQWDPELLLIGGGISANSVFMKLLQETVATRIAQHEGLRAVGIARLGPLRPCLLGNDAGLLGAVYATRQEEDR